MRWRFRCGDRGRAGVKTCAVMYGYGDREEMLRWEPDYVIERPEELLPRTA